MIINKYSIETYVIDCVMTVDFRLKYLEFPIGENELKEKENFFDETNVEKIVYIFGGRQS